MPRPKAPPKPKKPNRGSPVVTPEKWALFLELLAETGNVTHAALGANLSRSTVYARHDADDAFRAAWDAALKLGGLALEDEARRRAMAGSDRLMEFLLKGIYPEKYRERTETKLTGAINVKRVHELSDEELAAIAAGGRGRAAEAEEGED